MSSWIPRKRVFVALLTGSLVGLAALMTVIWYLAEHRMYTFQRAILVLAAMLALVVFLLVACGVGGLILVLWKGKMFTFTNNIVNVAINLLFPVTLQVGKIMGIDENKIKSSFIEVNNQLVLLKKVRVSPGEILILAPHCIQFSGCPYKVTRDIKNCKQCRQCQVADFISIRDEFRVHVAVVTGGTLARNYVKKYNPKAIIAVACERDLTSGILDCYPLPVLGVLNDRPNGPCQDTRVRLEIVRSAVRTFIERG